MLFIRRLAPPAGLSFAYAPFGPASSQFVPPTQTSANSYTGRAFTLGIAGLHVDTAPGGVNGHRWRYIFDSSGQVGSAVELTGGSTTAVGTIATTIAVSASILAAGSFEAQRELIGTPAATTDMTVCQEYEDALDASVSYLVAGDGALNIGGDVTDKFMGFFRTGGQTSEGPTQNIVGTPGSLVHFYFRGAFDGGAGTHTYDFALRKNGVDAYVTSLSGSPGVAFAFSATISVAVTTNDLLSIRYRRTAGTGTTVVAYITVSFKGA